MFVLEFNLRLSFLRTKATSRQICPLQTTDDTFPFNLGPTGSGPAFQCPQDYLGFLRQKKRLLSVPALATVPEYKARAGIRQGEHPCVRMGIRFNGVLSLWTGRKQNTSWQLSDTLQCLGNGYVSAWCHDVQPGDKRLFFIW